MIEGIFFFLNRITLRKVTMDDEDVIKGRAGYYFCLSHSKRTENSSEWRVRLTSNPSTASHEPKLALPKPSMKGRFCISYKYPEVAGRQLLCMQKQLVWTHCQANAWWIPATPSWVLEISCSLKFRLRHKILIN